MIRLPRKFRFGAACGVLLAASLVAGCATDTMQKLASSPDEKQRHFSFPLLWNGEREPEDASGIDTEAFNKGSQLIGETRVDYIGALNSDNGYDGSPAEKAELQLISSAGGRAVEREGALTVDFENDPLDYFVRQMLGGFLGINYVTAGPLTGNVTFRTEKPIKRSQALAVVRSILAQRGYVLKLIGGVFHISTPDVAEATEQNAAIGRSGELVTRVVNMPGRVDDSLAQSLGAVVPTGISIAVSPEKNSLIVRASATEIGEAEQLVRTFVSGNNAKNLFGVVYLHHSPPENVAEKLRAFFVAQGVSADLAPQSIIPLEERQALLVSARSRNAIENVRKIASQLDFGLEDETTLRIIPLKYLAAADIAPQISSLFDGKDRAVSTRNAGESGPQVEAKLASLGDGANAPDRPAGARDKRSKGADDRVAEAFEARPSGDISIDAGSDVSIVADERNNVLLVHSSYRNFKRIKAAVRALDVPLSQVVIEATIIEVKITDELKFGVQWYLAGHGFTLRSSNSSGVDSSGLGGLVATAERLSSGISVSAVIDALDDVTDVTVVSSPYLTVMNRKEARLVVGDQIPFSTTTQSASGDGNVTVTQEIDVRDTGVILEVLPIIRANNSVELHIAQEISSAELQSGEVNLTPTVTTRQITSDIVVQSGRTVLLGGLIQDRTEAQQSGVPFLRKAPLVGKLFEQTNDADLRTEVIVMITPRVARTSSEIERITNEVRDHLELSGPFPERPVDDFVK